MSGPVDLHADEAGPAGAPVLVLAGSLGTTGAMWDPVVPALAQRLRVVRVDLRGHGRSPVPEGPYAMAGLGADVVALLDRLGVERASFCGLSIGGMVGLWLGAHAADRLDRLVVIGSAPYAGPAFGERAAAVRERGGTAGIADAVVANWLTPEHAQAHPERREWLTEMVLATSAEGYAACCDAIAAMDLREDLRSITVPTLVVAGDRDPVGPPEVLREVADAIPGARLEVVEHAAHLVAVERPDAVAALVLDHLAMMQ